MDHSIDFSKINDDVCKLVENNNIEGIRECKDPKKLQEIGNCATYKQNREIINFIISNYDVNEIEMAQYTRDRKLITYILKLCKEKLDKMYYY